MHRVLAKEAAGTALIVIVLLLSATSGAAAREWEAGRIATASVSGHGATDKAKSKRFGKQDIWWVYCVSGGDRTYSVVSRENPAKTGLAVNTPVKFSKSRNRLYILNSKGRRLILRISGEGETKSCP